jgi:hypothetical protein
MSETGGIVSNPSVDRFEDASNISYKSLVITH